MRAPAWLVLALASIAGAAGACTTEVSNAAVHESELRCAERLLERSLPAHFEPPPVPADNPPNAAKLALGRRLFYEPRLSRNATQSCASCHRQALAFTDGRARAEGATGQAHPRSSMSLANVAYADTLAWANPLLRRLEAQVLVPMFAEFPVELGTRGSGEALLAELADDAAYRGLFEQAFTGSDEPVSLHRLTHALSSFERALISAASPYDRYLAGERDALDAAAQRGLQLFRSERLGCAGCHAGFTLDASGAVRAGVDAFQNTALYAAEGDGADPASSGLAELTGQPEDRGRFKIPTLRNVALTAPYMHDGSVESLDAVLDHYAAGGRQADNPLKSERLRGFSLAQGERADLLAFLHALTDETFVSDMCLSDPFAAAAGDR